MNKTIKDINIGDKFIKLSSGLESQVTDKTTNSIELFNKKKTPEGIDSKNWYTFNDFLKQFKEIEKAKQ